MTRLHQPYRPAVGDNFVATCCAEHTLDKRGKFEIAPTFSLLAVENEQAFVSFV